MTDTTTLIQRLRLMSPDLIGGEAADALEQQAAQIAEKDAEIESWRKFAVEVKAELLALRADAERYRWLCRNNFDREKMQVHTWIQTWEPHSQTGD